MMLDFKPIKITMTIENVRVEQEDSLRIKVKCNHPLILAKAWKYLKKAKLARQMKQRVFFDSDPYNYSSYTIGNTTVGKNYVINSETLKYFADMLVRSEWFYLLPDGDNPNLIELGANRCLYAWLELPWLQRRITNPSKVKPRKLLS